LGDAVAARAPVLRVVMAAPGPVAPSNNKNTENIYRITIVYIL